MPSTFIPRGGDEGQRQEDEGKTESAAALIEILGAKVCQLLVEQSGALAHRLQLLGHAGEAVGGFAYVQPVVFGQPVEIERGEGHQSVAIGRDEAAKGDRLGPYPGDCRAQFVDVARLQIAFAIIEPVAEIGDLGIELLADRTGEAGDEIAPILIRRPHLAHKGAGPTIVEGTELIAATTHTGSTKAVRIPIRRPRDGS